MSVMVIKSSVRDYTVENTASLQAALAAASVGPEVYTIVDRALFALPHAAALEALDPGRTIKIEATEGQKSYARIETIFEQLLQSGFRRGCTLLGVGGGIVQDITCFVASVTFRGVPWDLIPTTLLAQCDSCIGSKSSINVGRFKNQIGTFYPPRKVFIANSVLETLSDDDLRSGLGEVIKLHLIAGGAEYDSLVRALQDGMPPVSALASLVKGSLAIKKRFIEEDEFDCGIRNFLNYGHTFGHAYESVTSFGIPHGIAVTLGVVSAAFASEQLGLAPPGYFREIDALARPYYSPYEKRLAGTDAEVIVQAMCLDKKSTRGSVNCILTRGPGRMEKVPLDPETELRSLVAEIKKEIFP